MKKIRLYSLFIFLVTPAVELCLSFIRFIRNDWVGYRADCIAGFLIYLLITNLLLQKLARKVSSKFIFLSAITGWFALVGPACLTDFSDTMGSLPDMMVHLLGICAGYMFYKRDKLILKTALAFSILVVMFTSTYGYTLWLFKLNYGNYSGKVSTITPKLNIIDEHNRAFTVGRGKITVLDFWFIGCGSCLREFPEFQKSYSIFKKNDNVQFASVNVYGGRDGGANPYNYLKRQGYNFPMAICHDQKVADKIGTYGLPAILVFNAQGYLVYRGDYTGVQNAIIDALKTPPLKQLADNN